MTMSRTRVGSRWTILAFSPESSDKLNHNDEQRFSTKALLILIARKLIDANYRATPLFDAMGPCSSC